MKQYPLVDFSAVYSIQDYSNTTSFSLRSTKYTDNKVEIQQASNILNSISDVSNQYKFEIAVVWNYNPLKDTTKFKVTFHKDINDNMMKCVKRE